jgi:raffinose/stachyose/melibiose transport system permease protein
MFSKLGLVNSLFGLIIIYIAMWTPFSTLLMRSYFVKVPNELLEAALIDGASKWKAFWKVVFPVARPGVTTTLLIVTMWSWNNLLLPLTFINNENLKPVTVAVAMLEGKWSSSWEIIMAASILAALPIIVLFIFSHRNFVEGLAGTGLKG